MWYEIVKRLKNAFFKKDEQKEKSCCCNPHNINTNCK